MNLYIWQGTNPVSNEWHSNGSVAVVAHDLDHARQQLTEQATEGEWGTFGQAKDHEVTLIWMTDPPTRTYRLDATTDEFDVDPDDIYPPEVLTFPDSGCC